MRTANRRLVGGRYRGITDVKRELLEMAGEMNDLADKYVAIPDLVKFHRAIANKLMECYSQVNKLGLY